MPAKEFASAAVPTGERHSRMPVMPALFHNTVRTSCSRFAIASTSDPFVSGAGSSTSSITNAGPTIITTSTPPYSHGEYPLAVIIAAIQAEMPPPHRLPALYQPPALPRSASLNPAAINPPLQLPISPETTWATNAKPRNGTTWSGNGIWSETNRQPPPSSARTTSKCLRRFEKSTTGAKTNWNQEETICSDTNKQK